MDWVFKVVLTAATVWVVMVVAGRSGRRLAGVAAALPTITAPTLAWLIHERGVGFAMDAAIASVSACAMLAIFTLGYALASRRRGHVCALLCGLAGALILAWPAYAASAGLAEALMLGLGCSALALYCMPRCAPEAVALPHPRRSLACAALAAAGLTALAATAGPALGSFATGLLSSLPVISAAVAMFEHARGGHRAVATFLRGYAWGLFGKAAFGAAFVLLAPHVGAAAALALACACAGLMSLVRPGQWLIGLPPLRPGSAGPGRG
ncbi:hypothetical protein CKO44_23410 [Rubrivivax gelatinosus]|uniref:hypothetical protein n=1 Tax=Rubrivivax gelatinosus TaxID=28068 RepID=UPI001908F1F0|nr:hypothetical protein [Rubrivivax gelatinosus]MBK1616396.1 hypothetical protein [Rubrivivax gelatinosus]